MPNLRSQAGHQEAPTRPDLIDDALLTVFPHCTFVAQILPASQAGGKTLGGWLLARVDQRSIW
jgi:hypothetical protein